MICKPKIVTIRPFTEKIVWPCFYKAYSSHTTLWGKQRSGVSLFYMWEKRLWEEKVNQLMPHSLKKKKGIYTGAQTASDIVLIPTQVCRLWLNSTQIMDQVVWGRLANRL